MATTVIMPALGISQDTGTVVRWLKNVGEPISKGDILAEIETDKAVVDLEAPATGTLATITAAIGEAIPIGQAIALILAAGEQSPASVLPASEANKSRHIPDSAPRRISPLASRIAAEHHLDLSAVQPAGRRIQKADVLTHLQISTSAATNSHARLSPATPKARRLAAEQGKDLTSLQGSGPEGAVLAADVLHAPTSDIRPIPAAQAQEDEASTSQELAMSTIWRVMAEHTTQSWRNAPHFSLMREIDASRLVAWHSHIQQRLAAKVSYTDLLVKVVASTLRAHPRLNASWQQGKIIVHNEVNIGLAMAVEDGLVVPVIQQADQVGLHEIVRQRQELTTLARTHALRPQNIQGGTFTISNLGMYGIDAFNALINAPQAAILAVGRIAERVVPVQGKIVICPTLILTLSCDHRIIDGVRGAQFLTTLADRLEEPLELLM